MTLTREQILRSGLRTKEVQVPQWDGAVTICEIPVSKRTELLRSLVGADGVVKPVDAEIELRLFIAGMREPLFGAEDAAALQDVSGAAVSLVAREIMALNGFLDAAQDEARGEF